MRVSVCFYSYFKDLTGCAQTTETLADGATLGELHQKLMARFQKLAAMKKSTLMAVGVDYQRRDYVLKEGDEIMVKVLEIDRQGKIRLSQRELLESEQSARGNE